MGADLFESYAGAVIATATLAPKLAAQFLDQTLPLADQLRDFNMILSAAVALPLWLDGFGIVASLVGIAYIRNSKLDDRTSLETLLSIIGKGVWLASAITGVFTLISVFILFHVSEACKRREIGSSY
jgi:Na+/H+-translocating membrane pyrophosphatase